MSENPLLEVRYDIPFSQIRPEHIEPAIQTLLAQAEAELEAILRVEGPRTFENTLLPLDRLGEGLSYAFTLVAHLESVASTPELRAAYKAIIPPITAFSTKVQISAELYQALKDFAATPEASQLSPDWARFLKLRLDEFRRQGADLPPEKKARLEALNTRLSEITAQFEQNLTDSTADWELYLDESQVAGLPPSALEAARQSARAKGREGYRFTLQQPSYLALQTYLDDAEIRKQVYLAYHRRATEPGRDNRPLIDEILALRREKAELLGYANFADYVLENRMAGKAETALRFEQDLKAAYEPHFKKELATLEAFRRELEGPQAPPLEPWDIAYYAEKQRKALYDFDEEELRPYFALPQVLEGLFEIVRRVFGLEVREVTGVETWHPEVKTYEIYREGRRICRFFTDWHPRENKRGGAWMNTLIRGVRNGNATEPHLGLMCGNLTPPVGDRPALLTHREVETIFHEFGHLLHLALSSVEARSLVGTQVARDFVELPSQIMENWCWEREALDLFARHYQTGEPIPDELFEKMLRAKNYWAANLGMRQLAFGTVDLALHVHYTPSDGDVVAYARQVMQPFMPAPLPQDYAFVAGFAHLFGHPVGYAAGYYSYKWSEVLDADAFSRFKAEGIFNRQTGEDFITHILSKGNSADPAELFRRFLGRDPDPRALLARSGLLD
ncbi:M3 family metallopeptidase [Meiothermus ruber]|jgi:oligopeptidase A|uniref:oligopeptidase A n=1 Tax=Meiothermus ruber (strain ATCC 35948 / DSM 1279 / VKM B-1258 / 21) TaxID=504728 RepID=D3PKU0_MEIRD|nr:M3 family metallopeptidase [Meiothermus ruber]ADD28964.1 Oligopeptidase A [Meiothermus ruber DSM 1279]AGK05586.1 oligopeptidase A [Meiothermus ruber DSM 1279]MCL6528703.1 M3 family metallopeptidase [Meiothermus ruber]